MIDFLAQYKTVMHEIRHGTDHSVFDAMSRLNITFDQLDQRLRQYDDSIIADLITNRRFDVALEAYKQGYRHATSGACNGNEIHLLASRIGSPGASNFGYALIESGIDLGVSDRRGITGLYAMAFAIMIPANCNDETMGFLLTCIQSASTQAVHAKNKAGVSAWDIIHSHGNETMINLVEKLHGTT